jgi:hypothetical protein
MQKRKIGKSVIQRSLLNTKRALLSMKVIPDGADKPLEPLPGTVEINAEDKSATVLWNELMPEYKGLLDAIVENKQRYDQ